MQLLAHCHGVAVGDGGYLARGIAVDMVEQCGGAHPLGQLCQGLVEGLVVEGLVP